MFNSDFKTLSLKAGVITSLLLGGCIATTFPYMRAETAQRLAAPAWMIKRDIPAGQFNLLAYERIHERGAIAHVYIEGDGSAFTSPKEWTTNPTPENPVALHLATKDKADNVIYLARPCQYITTTQSGASCDDKYWKEERFSSEVIESYESALDEIARRYDISGFHLIGYSGGGAIASILAAERQDILSLRTVAGILDHEAQVAATASKQSMSRSLNAVDYGVDLTRMPQYHFVGGQDAIVPPAVLHSYLQAMPPSHCVQSMVVQEAGYETGWVDKWPELLKLPVHCYSKNGPDVYEGATPKTDAKPFYTLPEKPAKP